MTDQEKIKAYDKALERASKLRVQNPFDTVSQMMEHIFPELKDSEDERIRKAIIEYIKIGTYHKDWIAWLEKQKLIEWSDYDRCMLSNIVDDENCPLEREVIEWLKSLRPQPKVEWSKEDERYMEDVIELVETFIDDEDCGDMSYGEHKEFYMKRINWLKSLRLRNHWKPSENKLTRLKRYYIMGGGKYSCNRS